MTTQTQFIALGKFSFQLAGTTPRYSGPTCSPKCSEHRGFGGGNHVLASHSAAWGQGMGTVHVSNLTKAKRSS